MKKQLMVGLLSAGLVVAMLPGVAVAKDDGKSDCKKGGWTEWVRDDGSDFADQGECVAYVAEGGTLMAPMSKTPIQIACEGLDGEYQAPYWADYDGTLVDYPEGCFWFEIDSTAYQPAGSTLWPICATTTGGMAGGFTPYPWHACDLPD